VCLLRKLPGAQRTRQQYTGRAGEMVLVGAGGGLGRSAISGDSTGAINDDWLAGYPLRVIAPCKEV
jgi:hypothetical protein